MFHVWDTVSTFIHLPRMFCLNNGLDDLDLLYIRFTYYTKVNLQWCFRLSQWFSLLFGAMDEARGFCMVAHFTVRSPAGQNPLNRSGIIWRAVGGLGPTSVLTLVVIRLISPTCGSFANINFTTCRVPWYCVTQMTSEGFNHNQKRGNMMLNWCQAIAL